MSESLSTLARPYARAVFEMARDSSDYDRWSQVLSALNVITSDKTMVELVSNPRVERDQIAQLVVDVAGDALPPQGANLVRLLARNRRLTVVSEIADQYEKMRAEAESLIEAELETAMDVTGDQADRLADALSKRLGRQVKLHPRTNPELIGGAVIRAGDWVVDGSVRARLKKLSGALTA